VVFSFFDILLAVIAVRRHGPCATLLLCITEFTSSHRCAPTQTLHNFVTMHYQIVRLLVRAALWALHSLASLSGCAMVYRNHRGMGAQWCTKTTEGWVRWCTETTIGRVGNGVRKPLIDGCVMVYGSRRWVVQDGVLKPSLGRCGMEYKNCHWAGAWRCTKTTGRRLRAGTHHILAAAGTPGRLVPVAIYGQIIIGCLILAVIEHYTMDNTYGVGKAAAQDNILSE
jgi:hypothetical protein